MRFADYFRYQPARRGDSLLAGLWAIGTLLFSANVIGPKLFLLHIYGWSKVQQEHLRFLAMPKGGPWPVSNGDLISEGHFVHYFLVTGVCWLALFFATYPLLRRLLPRAATPRSSL